MSIRRDESGFILLVFLPGPSRVGYEVREGYGLLFLGFSLLQYQMHTSRISVMSKHHRSQIISHSTEYSVFTRMIFLFCWQSWCLVEHSDGYDGCDESLWHKHDDQSIQSKTLHPQVID